MNAEEPLSDLVARQEALDRLIGLYEQAEVLTKAKGVETLGEAGPEGEALVAEIAAAEAALEALGT
jgi:hypothetical protein